MTGHLATLTAAAAQQAVIPTFFGALTMAREFWAEDPSWTDPGDGNYLTTWRDNGTLEDDLTAGSTNTVVKPTYIAAGLDSLPTVRFLATSETTGGYMRTASGTINPPFTFGVIGRFDTSVTSVEYLTDSSVTTAGDRAIIGALAAGGGDWRLYNSNTHFLALGTPDTDLHLFMGYVADGSLKLYVDGTLVGELTSGTADAVTGFVLGGNGAGTGQLLDGEISYAFMYEGDMMADAFYAPWYQLIGEHYPTLDLAVPSNGWTGDENGLIYEPMIRTDRLASVSGVTLSVNSPTKDTANNPLLQTAGTPTDTWDYYKGYCSVNKVGSTYHLHYNANDDSGTTQNMSYATSSDGITWTKPTVGRLTFDGNTDNSIVRLGPVCTSALYVADLDEWYYTSEEANGTRIYKSSSASSVWSTAKSNLIRAGLVYSEGKSLVRTPGGQWVAYYSFGQASQTRSIGAWQSVTTDPAGAWTDVGTVIATEGTTDQVYGMGVTRIGDTYFGLVMRYNKTTEHIWFDLFTSVNALDWTQEADTWIDVGTTGAFDEGILINGNFVDDTTTTIIYYAGQDQDHASSWPIDARIARATIAKDRIGQASGTGTVTTVLLNASSGSTLTLNCDAAGGSITVAVLDAAGDVLSGFDDTDMTAITTDTLAVTPSWGGSPMPTQQDISLRFTLTDATLHAYRITPA